MMLYLKITNLFEPQQVFFCFDRSYRCVFFVSNGRVIFVGHLRVLIGDPSRLRSSLVEVLP